jgi:hypothetical protein
MSFCLKFRHLYRSLAFVLVSLLVFEMSANGQVTSKPASNVKKVIDAKKWNAVQNYYFMLTGVELSKNNANYSQLLSISQNLSDAEITNRSQSANWNAIADIVVNDFYFNRVTLADFAARMSNLDNATNQSPGDLQFMLSELFKKGVDYRNVLTLPYELKFTNAMNSHEVELSDAKIVFSKAQNEASQDFSGILSTKEFADKFLSAGTNRRPVKYLMENFLCSPMSSIKDYEIADTYVGVDITRKPGEDPTKYQSDCRGCHSWMDGMRGAFAYSDYSTGRGIFGKTLDVRPKMNNNAFTYPSGYKVIDDSWEFHLSWAQRAQLGINTLKGKGYKSLGLALANSDGFDACMPRQIIKSVCQTMPTIEEVKNNKLLLSDHNYNLKEVAKAATLSPVCQKTIDSGKKIKTFRGVLHGFHNLSAIKSKGFSIKIEPSEVSSLPQLGLPSEVGAATIATLIKYATSNCSAVGFINYKTYVGGRYNPNNYKNAETENNIIDLKSSILGRDLTSSEIQEIKNFMKENENPNLVNYCAYSLIGHPEFLFNPYGGE